MSEFMDQGWILEPPRVGDTLGGHSGSLYSHGTGDVTSGIQHQVGDTVLVLIAAIPEGDLGGQGQQLGEESSALGTGEVAPGEVTLGEVTLGR